MGTGGSVTQWIGQFKAGEEQALEKLRQRYWPYLVRLAHKKLAGVRGGAVDDEDVVQEAFWSFYRSFRKGRLPVLENRQHVLALLTIITVHQAANHREREGCVKRGAGRVQGESALEFLVGSTSSARGIEQVEDSALAPDEEVVAHDMYSHYVNALPEDLRHIAEQYLANRPLDAIARAKRCSVSTVRRKIKSFILPQWQRMAADSVNSEE